MLIISMDIVNHPDYIEGDIDIEFIERGRGDC